MLKKYFKQINKPFSLGIKLAPLYGIMNNFINGLTRSNLSRLASPKLFFHLLLYKSPVAKCKEENIFHFFKSSSAGVKLLRDREKERKREREKEREREREREIERERKREREREKEREREREKEREREREREGERER